MSGEPTDSSPGTPGVKANGPRLSETLSRLDKVCHEIARGNYGNTDDLFALTVDPTASQTIRELAESFGSMLVQVEAREFRLTGLIEELREAHRQLEDANRQLARENVTLARKVQTLTIEIDRQRFKREVGEIIETDYFQDLQKRARSMRARVRGAGAPPDGSPESGPTADGKNPNGEPQDGP